MEFRAPTSKQMQALFRAKRKARQKLAKLPFEEKILTLIKLQKIANSLRIVAKGIKGRPWSIQG